MGFIKRIAILNVAHKMQFKRDKRDETIIHSQEPFYFWGKKTSMCICVWYTYWEKQLLPIYWRPRKQLDPKCVIVRANGMEKKKNFGAFLFVIWKILSFFSFWDWQQNEKENRIDCDVINSIEMHFKTNCSYNEMHLPSHFVCFTPCFFSFSLALALFCCCCRSAWATCSSKHRFRHVVPNEKH